MLLRKLSQTLKVSLALLLATLSTGLLQVTPAYATTGGYPEYGQPSWYDVCGTANDTFTLPNVSHDHKYKYEINNVDTGINDNKTYNAWDYDANGLVNIELYEEKGYGNNKYWDKVDEWSKTYTNVPCDTPESDKIQFCHNENNPHLIETSKNAFYNAGHTNLGDSAHVGDVYPAGSIVKQGVTYTWEARGDQSLLLTDCKAQPTPVASTIVETDMTCDGHFTRTNTVLTPYKWDAATKTWVLDPANATVTPGVWVLVRPLTNAEKAQLDCAKPEQPQSQVRYTYDFDKSCEAGVTKTITTITTNYVFDIDSWSWKPVETSSTSAPIFVRSLNSWEKIWLKCDKPTKPEDINWNKNKTRMSCENGVEQKTFTKTIGWKFDYKHWKWVPIFDINSGTWTHVRDLTDAEKADLDCPVPPVEEPEEPETPGQVLGDSDDKTPPQVLATSTEMPATIPATGGESTGNPYLILVASLVAYGAVYLIQGRRTLTKQNN